MDLILGYLAGLMTLINPCVLPVLPITEFVDFKASWCSICAAQARVLEALKAANPAYDAAITFINVDWDQYGEDPLTQRLNIPRRSTLVVLKGQDELGRIVAGTSTEEIQALMDVALAAATAS